MDRFFDNRDYRKLAREQSRRNALARFSALPDSGLIAANGLAEMLGVSVSTVRRKAELDFHFPKPVELAKSHSSFSVGAIRRYFACIQCPGEYALPKDSAVEASSTGSV